MDKKERDNKRAIETERYRDRERQYLFVFNGSMWENCDKNSQRQKHC